MSTNGCNSSCSGDISDTMGKQGSTDGKHMEIMILVFLMTCLLVFLAVFGAWRRTSSLLLWKVMLWISYITSVAMIPYILGLIQQAPFVNELLIIWGMLLLIVYAFPDSFSAYSPEDVAQWRMNYVQFLSKFGALAILWVKGPSRKLKSDIMVMYLFTLIVFLKVMKRSIAHFAASPQTIEEKAKLSEVYMKYEHKLSEESAINPDKMNGYQYIVGVAGSTTLTLDDVLLVSPSNPSNLTKLIEKNEVVTLEKVWNCQGGLLKTGDPENRLKDICLSYSLLKILYLKCAGYALPMEAKPKARKLILDGLLSKKEKDRVFRVIEVELKLLYELIYTKYPLYASSKFAMLRVLEFVLSLAVCGLSAYDISKFAYSHESIEVAEVYGFNLDGLVTYVLLGMIAFAEYAQVWMIFSSEWVKAALIFNYVANKYCLNNIFAEKLITKVCKPWIWKPWARLLRQYSIIESKGYGTKPWISAIASAIYPDKNRDWQCERKAVQLSKDVKEVVLDSLRNNRPNLENGRCSPRHNGIYYEEHSVGSKCEHEAEVILIWHIATSYCKYSLSGSKNDKYFNIANDLSNYLAYLVAFAPRMLPPPHFEPQFHFRRVMKEARETFDGCKNLEDRIHKFLQLATQDNQTIIVRGARLGKKLFQRENEGVWKTLAEFWSDMALCAATSGEVRTHLAKLADGGEFITHLWALLHHAGYSPRTCPDSSDVASTVADNQPSKVLDV